MPGLVIAGVQPGSGADQAGLRGTSIQPFSLGDIIQQMDGKDVRNSNDYYLALSHHRPGDSDPHPNLARRKIADTAGEARLIGSS